MALSPGDRVGAYEVVAALGAGSMGEVYRAHDRTLGRDVALKVLAGSVAGDRDRLARLEREARILASLNHPNIATIHGFEQSESGPALVLELVEGPTLQDRLARGAQPLDEALRCARQVAEALEAAHERGVIHRDLKPANIKIRPDGTVKVLDFGIAKLLDEDGRAGAAASTMTATAPGMMIGTPLYMSPEQARGGEVTRQSDVWAFGTILFEMLSGKRAFTGQTTPDVLAAILQGSPDWGALPSVTPPGIARLVRRCLEPDPKARLRDVGDARLDIEDEERAMRAGPLPNKKGDGGPGASWWRSWAFGLASGLGTAAVAGALYLGLIRGVEEPRPEIRLQLAPPAGTRFVSFPPAISPDGRHIVFIAAPEAGGPARMWLRPLSASDATELPGTERAMYPFWSADSESVGFFADGELKRVAVAGGNPIPVCKAPAGRGGLWLDDGMIVFAPGPNTPLMRVDAAGGEPGVFTNFAAGETSHRFPQRLPGRQPLYYVASSAPENNGTRLASVDEPQRAITFIRSLGVGEYVKGFLLSPQASGLVMAQRMTLPDGDLTGEPMEIAPSRISETLGRFMMATAPAGVIATLGSADGVGQLTWTNRAGAALETVGPPASQLGVELSPDGQQVATVRAGEIWTMSLARPVANRVSEQGRSRHPVWSPESTRLLSMYQGRSPGTFDVVTITLASGATTTEHKDTTAVRPMGWTRDGRKVWIRNYPTESGISDQAVKRFVVHLPER